MKLFNVYFFTFLCLGCVILFSACEKDLPANIPTATSLEVNPQINIAEPICYNQEVYYSMTMSSKDLIGLQSIEIIRNGTERLLRLTDLEPQMNLNWYYQTREDDINDLVTLEFILTDVSGVEARHLSGFEVIEDFNYVVGPFSILTAYDLKFNTATNIGNIQSDIIVSTETSSCGDNCLKHKHWIYPENGVEMYSFPDDFYYSVDHRALKEEEIRQAIEQKEPLTELMAYTSFLEDLDDNQLYVNNTPVILLIGEEKEICIFQIADPTGLWRYKKKEIFTGQ